MEVTDDRGVAVACPRTLPAAGVSVTCTGSGVAAAGQDRNVGTVVATASGIRYTASDESFYFGGRSPASRIQKFTNGQDVRQAPGPSIPVGSPVTWTYVVTNTECGCVHQHGGDRRPWRRRGLSEDVAGAGRVRDVHGIWRRGGGSGTATSPRWSPPSNGTRHSDVDESFYLGVEEDEDADNARKVQLCHRTGNGSYHLIEVSVNAERAHRGHGDGKAGESVPGSPGRVFTASCGVR